MYNRIGSFKLVNYLSVGIKNNVDEKELANTVIDFVDMANRENALIYLIQTIEYGDFEIELNCAGIDFKYFKKGDRFEYNFNLHNYKIVATCIVKENGIVNTGISVVAL